MKLVKFFVISNQWRIQDFPLWGRRPPMHTLFGKNVCENKRNGPVGGARRRRPLDPPMLIIHNLS